MQNHAKVLLTFFIYYEFSLSVNLAPIPTGVVLFTLLMIGNKLLLLYAYEASYIEKNFRRYSVVENCFQTGVLFSKRRITVTL